MSIHNIFQCLAVNGGLAALLVLPLLPFSFRFASEKKWPEILLLALTIGCSLQAVVGLLWSHLIGTAPQGEVIGYFVLCLGLTCLIRLKKQPGRIKNPPIFRLSAPEVILLVILLLAFWVRSIHPLQTWALGQSDAYTHLHYLHLIADQGRLENVVYPSGYHWLLALPVLVFHIDPYVMARFGGAFFGTAMVLAVYVFLQDLFDRRAAVFGSFCAACFPGMLLLMKTGVGAFANQFGLLLVPTMLWAYVGITGKRERVSMLLFIAAGLGMAAAVPMMLIHVFLLIGLERTIFLLKEKRAWLTRTALVVFCCLPAILLIAFHFCQAGAGQRYQTARMLTSYGEKNKGIAEKIIVRVNKSQATSGNRLSRLIVQSPYFRLLMDFCSVKRLGFSQVYFDSLAVVLFVFFAAAMLYGSIRGHTGYFVLGLWGVLTSVQAGTGFLQFTAYQREGWSLLVATSCLSGVLAGLLYEYTCKATFMRVALGMTMVLSAAWTLQHPPGHPAIQSSAESLVIRTVRFLAQHLQDRTSCQSSATPACRLVNSLHRTLPLTVVSRKFVGWRNQGELIPNVLPRESNMASLLVGGRATKKGIVFSPKRQYVVLIDREKKILAREMTSAFAMVAPGMVKSVLQQQKNLYKANSLLLGYISTLPVKDWLTREVVLSPNLKAFVIIPRT